MSVDQTNPEMGGLDDSPSLVAGRKRLQLTNLQKLGVAGLVAIVFLAFIWVDFALQTKHNQAPPKLDVRPNTRAFKPAPLLPLQQATEPSKKSTGPNEMSPEESPLFAYLDKSAASNPVEAGAHLVQQATRHIAPPLSGTHSEAGNALSEQLKPTMTLASRAALLPHPNMLITKGTIIPCTLQTAINTDLAGFVKCVLPEAVRGTTGNVALLDRGTTIVGEIQSGLVQGQHRVFILWDRAETPQHAIISLASPGTDELGRAGVPGSVNNHFSQRFGAALMFSILDGAMRAGASLASGSGDGSGPSFNTFQSNGQSIANTSLKNSIDIPPTLEKNQGDNVSIIVANDIDFSSVYRLGMVE